MSPISKEQGDALKSQGTLAKLKLLIPDSGDMRNVAPVFLLLSRSHHSGANILLSGSTF